MTLDRIIELALTVSQEKDTTKRAAALERLMQMTSEKIPCLTGTIEREINLFDDFTLQDFCKIDFAGCDDEGRKYYRQDIRDINPMLYNFLVMDVLPLTGTIANSGGNRVRFGFCASLLYMALRNEQRRLREERELFTIAEDESEKEPQQEVSSKADGIVLSKREIKVFDVACWEDYDILKKDGNTYTFNQNVELYKLAFVCKQIKPTKTQWARYEKYFGVMGLRTSYGYFMERYTTTDRKGRVEYSQREKDFIKAIR